MIFIYIHTYIYIKVDRASDFHIMGHRLDFLAGVPLFEVT